MKNQLQLQVYSTISIENLKEQIMEKGQEFGIQPNDTLHLFLKRMKLNPSTFLFESLIDILRLRTHSDQNHHNYNQQRQPQNYRAHENNRI